MKKILLWGFGVFFACAFLWVLSVVFSVVTLGKWNTVANIFGYAALAVLPLTLLLVLFRKFLGAKNPH